MSTKSGQDHCFVLASNKSSTGSNKILKSIIAFQVNPNTIAKTKKVFNSLLNSSKDETLIGYIRHVLGLEDEVFKGFILKVFFYLDEKDIIRKCKDAIKADKIDEKKIDRVFSGLDSKTKCGDLI